MDGTREYYAKWNKPFGKRQIPYDLNNKSYLINNKLMNKIEPQAWNHGTHWKWPEERGEGDNGGKKGKGLDKEHVWMTHGHGQQCGNWLWGQTVGWVEEDKAGKLE